MTRLSLIIILTLFVSCGQQFNQNTILNFDRYKKAKEILINNLDEIKKAIDFHDSDSPADILNANRYYFENSVLKRNNSDLKSILALWDDKLIPDDNVFGTITITKDSTLIFRTGFNDIGMFSGVSHFIVYDPKENNGGLGKENSEILKKKKLEDHWFYIIEKKYYID